MNVYKRDLQLVEMLEDCQEESMTSFYGNREKMLIYRSNRKKKNS